MKLKGIKIQKLFDLFDYDIQLNQEDSLTILTGPNGYGKTTILNIIYNIFNQRFFYFQTLKFESISIYFPDEKQVTITKKPGKTQTLQSIRIVNNQQQLVVNHIPTVDIQIDLYEKGNISDAFVYNSDIESKLINELNKYIPIQRISQNSVLDNRTGKQISLRDFLIENINYLPIKIINLINKQGNEKISQVLNSTNVYIIKEERLLTQTRASNQLNSFDRTIEMYAKELQNMIAQKQIEAYQITQRLDSSFPKRLIECKETLSKEAFDIQFAALTEKQNQLQQYGISTSQQDVTEYNENTANVLTVYLKDSEEKAKVFDDLLSKINLFVRILNEKRFTFKYITIDSSKGFQFKTDNGDILNLTDLSSGEQQEVVLFYELLFKTNPNTLILIDEPEISLHVIWQKAFVQDLQEIAKMKQISFLVSTHSPQIINDRWDLTKDLYDLANVK